MSMTTDHFREALLRKSNIESIDELGALERHWIDYALSTNERGSQLADTIEDVRGSLAGLKWMDIGAGYGGLAVAAASRGAHVLAIELDPRLADLARENFRDHPTLDLELCVADITAVETQLERNVWDVVTLDNVIEHVRRPQQVFQRLTEFLSPTGIAYISAPNGRSFRQVMSDCHYQKFGVSLLDPVRGARYITLSEPHLEYDVSWLHRRGVYEALPSMFGLECQLINGADNEQSIRAELLVQIAELRAAFEEAQRESIPNEVLEDVSYLVTELIEDCEAAMRLADSIDPIRRARLYQELKREYLDEIWYFIIGWSTQPPRPTGLRPLAVKVSRRIKKLL
jgi:2-polyprenyl-3-methyl-5-hydroxy-6-metoxy-1,4-benzoquinol methylase